MARTMHDLHKTDDLIAAYAAEGEFEPALLEAAIGPAIDAVYAARDAGLVMHGAGAAAAVAVLRAVDEIVDLNRHTHNPEDDG